MDCMLRIWLSSMSVAMRMWLKYQSRFCPLCTSLALILINYAYKFEGLSSRKVGATSINSRSSRSHVVFTFIIESWWKTMRERWAFEARSSSCAAIEHLWQLTSAFSLPAKGTSSEIIFRGPRLLSGLRIIMCNFSCEDQVQQLENSNPSEKNWLFLLNSDMSLG